MRELDSAKLQLEILAQTILDKLPQNGSDDPISHLRHKLIREKRFLNRFPKKAARLSTEILDQYELSHTEEETHYFRETLIALGKSIVNRYRKIIQDRD